MTDGEQTFDKKFRLYIKPDMEGVREAKYTAEFLYTDEIFPCKDFEFYEDPVKDEDLPEVIGTYMMDLLLVDVTDKQADELLYLFKPHLVKYSVLEVTPKSGGLLNQDASVVTPKTEHEKEAPDNDKQRIIFPGPHIKDSGYYFHKSKIIVNTRSFGTETVNISGVDINRFPGYVAMCLNKYSDAEGLELHYKKGKKVTKFDLMPNGEHDQRIEAAIEKAEYAKNKILKKLKARKAHRKRPKK